jgi:hypothetical protein
MGGTHVQKALSQQLIGLTNQSAIKWLKQLEVSAPFLAGDGGLAAGGGGGLDEGA